jgi:hypothetical protein
MMEALAFIFIAIVLVFVFVLTTSHRNVRSSELIDRWAEAHGYRVVDTESRMIARGPYFFTTSKSQTVYYVTFADADGRERRAYVRCGSWLGGLWSDKVDVKWEE